MEKDFDSLVETFEFLEDWEDRYRHLIEMGKSLDGIGDNLKTSATKVEGCASQVWIVPEILGEGQEARISFKGDSDAIIVKGLIAALILLFSGQKVSDIVKIDAEAEFARLGLSNHLSRQRSNGLRAMIERVSFLAKSIMK